MPALGRPMKLGTLYDCHNNTIIPGLTLWDQLELKNDCEVTPLTQTQSKIITSDSLSEKMTALNIDGSLKVSVMTGNVEVGGSAKYINDKIATSHQSRITLQYKQTTRFEQLKMKDLGRHNVQYQHIFEKGVYSPTHVVTGISYGAQAFFVFDRMLGNGENKQQIYNQLKKNVEKIPQFTSVNKHDLKLNTSDRDEADKLEYKYYGDSPFDCNPVSFQGVADIFAKLPSMLAESDESAVPLTVWLYPLVNLDSNAAILIREINTKIIDKIQAILERLHQLILKCDDLIQSTILTGFSKFAEKVEVFKKLAQEFKTTIQQGIAQALPQVCAGEADETLLLDLISDYERSPFNLSRMEKWVERRYKEMDIVKAYTQGFKSISIIHSREDMNRLVMDFSVERIVAFSFSSIGLEDEYLSVLSRYARTHNPELYSPHTEWFEVVETLRRVRSKAKQFTELAKEGKASNTKFVVMCFDDGEQSTADGCSIFLYEDGGLKTKDFQIQVAPEKPNILENPKDQATESNTGIHVNRDRQNVATAMPPNYDVPTYRSSEAARRMDVESQNMKRGDVANARAPTHCLPSHQSSTATTHTYEYPHVRGAVDERRPPITNVPKHVSSEAASQIVPNTQFVGRRDEAFAQPPNSHVFLTSDRTTNLYPNSQFNEASLAAMQQQPNPPPCQALVSKANLYENTQFKKEKGQPASRQSNNRGFALEHEETVAAGNYMHLDSLFSKESEEATRSAFKLNEASGVDTAWQSKPNVPTPTYKHPSKVRNYGDQPSSPSRAQQRRENIRSRRNQELLQNCTLLKYGDPSKGEVTSYKIPLVSGTRHASDGYQTYRFGRKDTSKRHFVVMVVGATGAGKSTFINGMINYIFNVQWNDTFRFKIIASEGENEKGGQTQSQTQLITSYTIYPSKWSQLDYTVSIIDTPGFGDTRGIARDKIIVDQIRDFFLDSSRHYIDHINVIGFVTQASLARLTPTQRYVFDAVLAVFGKDIGGNIKILVTFADGQRPPVLDALEAANIPCSNHMFKFNNSALFASKAAEGQEDGEENSFDKMFWKMGYGSMKKFFAALVIIEARSLSLTKEVLEERQRLETAVEGIRPRIQMGCAKLDELQKEQAILQQHNADIQANKDFKYVVDVPQTRKVDISGESKYITNCTRCNYTCHYPCVYANDEDKQKCSAMIEDGTCKVCPNNCIWNMHANQQYRFEFFTEKVTKTFSDLESRYNEATGKKLTVEQIIKKHQEEFTNVQEIVFGLIEESHRSLQRLEAIALRPNPLSTLDYVDLLIQAEQNEAKPGYNDRLKALNNIRKNAEIMTRIKQRDFDPFESYGGNVPARKQAGVVAQKRELQRRDPFENYRKQFDVPKGVKHSPLKEACTIQ